MVFLGLIIIVLVFVMFCFFKDDKIKRESMKNDLAIEIPYDKHDPTIFENIIRDEGKNKDSISLLAKPEFKKPGKIYIDKYKKILIKNKDAEQWIKDHPFGEGVFKYKTFLSANKYTFWDSYGNISNNKTPSLRSYPTIPKKG